MSELAAFNLISALFLDMQRFNKLFHMIFLVASFPDPGWTSRLPVEIKGPLGATLASTRTMNVSVIWTGAIRRTLSLQIYH